MTMSDAEVQLISIAEAAARLAISPQTLRRHLSAWSVVPVRLGRRVLIRLHDVDRLARVAEGDGS